MFFLPEFFKCVFLQDGLLCNVYSFFSPLGSSEAGGEVADARCAGREVRTPSSIPRSRIPRSSGERIPERGVHVCVCVRVCEYHEE